MAVSKQILIRFQLSLLLVAYANGCYYNSIISFGDSLADTGNLLILDADDPPNSAYPPYGETYFRRATGRYSDGRLVIDFIAQSLGLSLVQPFFADRNGCSEIFSDGVNFAVVGATALNTSFLHEVGVTSSFTNISLEVQLDLFKQMLPSLCTTATDCKEFFQNTLVVMGEIGGNDYNYPFFEGIMSLEEIQELVPLVVNVIISAIQDLIELGAETIFVPGNFPIGCVPIYLASYESTDTEEYDPLTGCINWLNNFSEYHNQLLQTELNRTREIYTHANIIYIDYYNAALRLYQSPEQYGFSKGNALKACCGYGGTYNFNSTIKCGSTLVHSCDDPWSYLSWDGIHMTEAAYKWISKSLIENFDTMSHIGKSCVSSKVHDKYSNSE